MVRQMEEQGRECLRTPMALPLPPTAIICIHDALAANTIDELRKLKLSVPGDVSLFGVDDSFLARALQLSLIRLPGVSPLPDRQPQIGRAPFLISGRPGVEKQGKSV